MLPWYGVEYHITKLGLFLKAKLCNPQKDITNVKYIKTITLMYFMLLFFPTKFYSFRLLKKNWFSLDSITNVLVRLSTTIITYFIIIIIIVIIWAVVDGHVRWVYSGIRHLKEVTWILMNKFLHNTEDWPAWREGKRKMWHIEGKKRSNSTLFMTCWCFLYI
jgi:hypothetical protein